MDFLVDFVNLDICDSLIPLMGINIPFYSLTPVFPKYCL